MLISVLMVCVPRWCNGGLCFAVVLWFVFIGGVIVCVSQWCNGLLSSVVCNSLYSSVG